LGGKKKRSEQGNTGVEKIWGEKRRKQRAIGGVQNGNEKVQYVRRASKKKNPVTPNKCEQQREQNKTDQKRERKLVTPGSGRGEKKKAICDRVRARRLLKKEGKREISQTKGGRGEGRSTSQALQEKKKKKTKSHRDGLYEKKEGRIVGVPEERGGCPIEL